MLRPSSLFVSVARVSSLALFVASGALLFAGCSSSTNDAENSGDSGAGASSASTSGGSGGSGASGASGASSDAAISTPFDAGPYVVTPTDGGGAPDGFWDAGSIPAATNVMTFAFVNRTNGKYQDSEVYWQFTNDNVNELHSFAEKPYYDMPANNSGRMYFFLCAVGDSTCATDPTKSNYFDFIEHTIGPAQYDGNTTRVDAFGLKIAMRLHCADGFDIAVGEDYATFAEDRATTFANFLAAVPDEFKSAAEAPNAPYRIVQPGAAGFVDGGAYANYYSAFVDAIWSANGITIPKPGANGDGLGAYPDLSAAIYRHVGAAAGTFDANGKLLDMDLWKDPSTFYTAAPADYYARYWHAHALGNRAYGFPYDDVGSYSTYISHDHPQSMIVAIGW